MGICDQNDLPYKPNSEVMVSKPIGGVNMDYQNNNNRRASTTDSSVENMCQRGWPPGAFGGGPKPIGFMDSLFGCMRPMFSLISKATVIDIKAKQGEDWEIPFEAISDLEFLGSGAQGAVFSGKLRNEIVAVKKVRDVRETDIKNLRKLDHENIIKFK